MHAPEPVTGSAHLRSPLLLVLIGAVALAMHLSTIAAETNRTERRLLYVAEPGIRDYQEYGGHGVLIFDIDQGHQFVRRIPSAGLDEKGHAMNVKGICASA